MLELLFLLLPVAAAYGWFMGRNSEKQKELKGRASVAKNLSSGLNFLLTDQEDKAIEQLLQLLDVEAATIDTYLALANLFRRRGDWDKAIRIHEKLHQLKLPKQQAQKIQFELAKDYFSAGLYDRAEPLLSALVQAESIREAVLKQLFSLFTATHEWQKAMDFRAVVEQTDSRSLRIGVANFSCEAWRKEPAPNDVYRQLIQRYPVSLRPKYELAKKLIAEEEFAEARELLLAILLQRPQWAAELLPLVQQTTPEQAEWQTVLTELSRKHKNISATAKLAEFYAQGENLQQAENLLTEKLRQQPNIRLFLKFIQIRRLQDPSEPHLAEIEQMVQAYLDTKVLYHCRNCGFKTKQPYWLCPSCQQWETVEPMTGIDGR
ncbi:tetratricopeptide repeat protein [Rheinheimera sediminis]|nr:tetratricopeptide repeat protein [Rheinheimera sp. YQF-1]